MHSKEERKTSVFFLNVNLVNISIDDPQPKINISLVPNIIEIHFREVNCKALFMFSPRQFLISSI